MPVQHCRESGEKILYRVVDFLWQILGCYVLIHDASKASERLPILKLYKHILCSKAAWKTFAACWGYRMPLGCASSPAGSDVPGRWWFRLWALGEDGTNLCSGTVKAMPLNLIRSRDLKTDWLNHEFNYSEYQGDGESIFQKKQI